MWRRVRYEPGSVKAVSRRTEGSLGARNPYGGCTGARIRLATDRDTLVVRTGRIWHSSRWKFWARDGNLCPRSAENLVHFEVGGGFDSRCGQWQPFSMERFRTRNVRLSSVNVWSVLQSNRKAGHATLKAVSEGLDEQSSKIKMESR